MAESVFEAVKQSVTCLLYTSLEDLYNLLRAQEEKEAQYIATALEIYVTGSLNVFNHQSLSLIHI